MVAGIAVIRRAPSRSAALVPVPKSFKRTLLADGVRADEHPVLPGGEPAEDLGLHRLGAGEAQRCLHARSARRARAARARRAPGAPPRPSRARRACSVTRPSREGLLRVERAGRCGDVSCVERARRRLGSAASGASARRPSDRARSWRSSAARRARRCRAPPASSMNERSAASSSSASVPAKQLPGSTTAKRLRAETSRRASVRRNMPTISRTNQWSPCSRPARRRPPAPRRRRRGSSAPRVPTSRTLSAQQQHRVVELARHARAATRRRRLGLDRRRASVSTLSGAVTVSVAMRRVAVDRDLDPAIGDAVVAHLALERRQRDALGARGTVDSRPPAPWRARRPASSNFEGGAAPSTMPQAFARSARTPSALVQKRSARSRRTLRLSTSAREAAGAGQHAQQRHFGQRDGRGAVVDHDDLVAGQRHLVAAAGAGAVQRGQELQARMAARSPRCRCASRW